MPAHNTVVILDFGSQYTQLIARRIREQGVFSIILPCDSKLDRIQIYQPKAVVLSGGPNSVFEKGAPQLPEGFLAFQDKTKLPVMGICYGMQLLARQLGGTVISGKTREYGRTEIIGEHGERFQAWMSHGDEVKELPPGFTSVSSSADGKYASMSDTKRKIYALQFHPEVTHTENGHRFIREFLFEIAKIAADWTMQSVIEEQVSKIRGMVNPGEHVICGLSGGVDSTVAAALVHRAIGDRLHCIFVDHGLLRLQEQERVMGTFKDKLQLPVTCIDASERFLTKLKGVTDPEQKRKIIGAEFIAVFEEAAKKISTKIGPDASHAPRYLVQGTLYPDVIESSPKFNGYKHSAMIKSHHNVGGLPEKMHLKLIEPLRELFKDEVRAMGKELGISQELIGRHPFPGPGLGVRIIGEITHERLETLKQVDEVFVQSLREFGLYDKIWQAFAVFLPLKTVGVQGDGRTHDHVVALRAVTSSDGMTADWYPFDPQFLGMVSTRICNQVRGVNRVVYDVTSKPPATIEWE